MLQFSCFSSRVLVIAHAGSYADMVYRDTWTEQSLINIISDTCAFPCYDQSKVGLSLHRESAEVLFMTYSHNY